MTIIAIIQARMSSQRFPGKMMHEINHKPVLEYVIDRVRRAHHVDDIIVATSTDPSDDAIDQYCRKNRIRCYRGSLENVASRFQAILASLQCDAFIRICGDRPLLDHHLIDQGLELFFEGNKDMVTNVFPKSYPAGETVEILRSDLFSRWFPSFSTPDDFEHVTHFFYLHPEKFSIQNFSSGTEYHNVHLAIDTPDDMRKFKAIVDRMDRPHWEYTLNDIISLYRQV